MLKKKSLARVINRSSVKKDPGHVAAPIGKNKSSKLKHTPHLKGSINPDAVSSSMNSVTNFSQVNKVLQDGLEKPDSLKYNGKQSQSASNCTPENLFKSSIESPTLTTQQLLEQYPNICSGSEMTSSQSYQPPRPPKPLRLVIDRFS